MNVASERFVQDVADGAVARITRLFEEADLYAAGKPLKADSRDPLLRVLAADRIERIIAGDYRGGHQGGGNYLAPNNAPPTPQFLYRLHAYAWFARQLDRGSTGMRVIGQEGGDGDTAWVERVMDNPPDMSEPPSRWGQEQQTYDSYSASEARLGLALYRVGRQVAEKVTEWWTLEVIARGKPARDGRDLVERILKEIGDRLRWPRLSGLYDPPPPVRWPPAENF